jgi:L-fuculose-phosphate aldolase
MIIKVDRDGKKLEGKLNPSSEIKMHMRVYRERPDVNAVVHAHPPVATAFTVADIDLDQYVLPEAVLTIGAVPTCDYGTPSTMEIPDSLDPYLQDHDAFLLRNHGALTVGCTLTKAFFVMEEVEFNAVICKHAMDLGAVHEISRDQLAKLIIPICEQSSISDKEFLSEYIAESLLTWTVAGVAFEKQYAIVCKIIK